MSGKKAKQSSIVSFAMRGNPPKKPRLEETVQEKETVQVEEEETLQEEEEHTAQVEEKETEQEEMSEMAMESKETIKTNIKKYQEQPPTRALLIKNGPVNGHLLL